MNCQPKTIVIAGALPGQAHDLQRACKDLAVRLRFVERKDRARIPTGDHIVLLIKFLPHVWTNLAFKTFPRSRVHYHMGSAASAEQTIRDIAQGRVSVGKHR